MSEKKENNVLEIILKHGADWSYLDEKTKDDVINALCLRVLKLEADIEGIYDKLIGLS